MLRNRMLLSDLHTCWRLRNRMLLWDAVSGVGWGGVGMMTFFELAHMVDAMQQDASLGRGFRGGVGWGGDDDIL